MLSACLFGLVLSPPPAPETVTTDAPQEDFPTEDDDYDPRNSQYVRPASEEDVEREQEDLLARQMAKLEAISMKRQGEEEKTVVQHYKSVLDEMRSQAKSGRKEPPRSQSFDEIPVMHEVMPDMPTPRPRRRSEPLDFEPQEWPSNANDTEETLPELGEQPSNSMSKPEWEGLTVSEDLPLLPSKPLEWLNMAPGQCRSIIAALECKSNGYSALMGASLMDVVASAVQYNLDWQPLRCSAQDDWCNEGI